MFLKKLRRIFQKKKSSTKLSSAPAVIKPIMTTSVYDLPRSRSPVFCEGYDEAKDNITIRKGGIIKDFDLTKLNQIKFAVSKYPKLQTPAWGSSRPYGQNAVHFRFRYRAKISHFGRSSVIAKSSQVGMKSYGKSSSLVGTSKSSQFGKSSLSGNFRRNAPPHQSKRLDSPFSTTTSSRQHAATSSLC